MTPNTYKILSRAVEEGIRIGIARARKHTDTPTDAELEAAIFGAIMVEVCEVFDFDRPEEPVSIKPAAPARFPFCCPICEGNATILNATGSERILCPNCNGTRIVWGPSA